jgi:hypothetical protein
MPNAVRLEEKRLLGPIAGPITIHSSRPTARSFLCAVKHAMAHSFIGMHGQGSQSLVLQGSSVLTLHARVIGAHTACKLGSSRCSYYTLQLKVARQCPSAPMACRSVQSVLARCPLAAWSLLRHCQVPRSFARRRHTPAAPPKTISPFKLESPRMTRCLTKHANAMFLSFHNFLFHPKRPCTT